MLDEYLERCIKEHISASDIDALGIPYDALFKCFVVPPVYQALHTAYGYLY